MILPTSVGLNTLPKNLPTVAENFLKALVLPWYIQSLEYISHLYAENNQIKPNTFIRYNEGKKVINIINQDFAGE